MRISRRAEYALRALLLIAKNQKVRVHQIQELSERGNIPVKFLEQILLHLRNEGLLTSKRGVGGGYSLRKRPSDIVVLDIVELTRRTDRSLALRPGTPRRTVRLPRPDPLPVAPLNATDTRNGSRACSARRPCRISLTTAAANRSWPSISRGSASASWRISADLSRSPLFNRARYRLRSRARSLIPTGRRIPITPRTDRSWASDETDRRRSIRSHLTLTLPHCFRAQDGVQCRTHKRGRTGFDLRFRPRRHAEDDSLAS